MMQALAPPAWIARQAPGWMPRYSQNTDASIRCGSVKEYAHRTPSMSDSDRPASATAPIAASACRPMQLLPGSSPTAVSYAPVMNAFIVIAPSFRA
ncbi:hypothetical protein D3C87_1904750 [compost metagenome]